jgi:hypothetical protein
MELQSRSSRAWAFAFTVVVVVLVVTAALVLVFNSLRSIPRDVVEGGFEIAGRMRELAGAFRQGSVETTFVSYASELGGSNFLQVATLRQMEVYTREDRSSVLWGHLALPDVVVAATAPVEYTYYLDLEAPWTFDLADNVLLVNAPPIRFNAPSIDVSELHFDVRESSLLRDEEMVVEQLRSGLMELSRQRASDHIDLVREIARKRTRDFVHTWLSGAFRDADRYRVEVVFEDERAGVAVEALRD